MDNLVYSIIIPHKDILDLLRRCVSSIPRRDDIQVIVVDDNSDIREEEWRSFTEEYERVELILTKEGKGAGYARNVGLSHAKGEWVLFADADDFFYEGAFDVFDKYSGSSNDVFYFLCDSRECETLEPVEDRMPSIRANIKSRAIDGLRYRSIVPWGKMIRRSLIEESGLRFEEVEVSNDVMFSIKLGVAARNPEVIDSESLYCWTKRDDSLTGGQDIGRVKTRIRVARRANDYLKSHGLERYMIYPKLVGYFWPRHPLLFIWGIWMFRYKGQPIKYIKELFKISKNRIINRVNLHSHAG